MWTGVLNNPTEAEVEEVLKMYPDQAKELVVDKEVGEEGTPHLHIFASMVTKKRLAQMKSLITRAHWEKVKSRSHCIEYCSKGEVIFSQLKTVRGNRLAAAADLLIEQGLSAVGSTYPDQMILHARGFQAMQ